MTKKRIEGQKTENRPFANGKETKHWEEWGWKAEIGAKTRERAERMDSPWRMESLCTYYKHVLIKAE